MRFQSLPDLLFGTHVIGPFCERGQGVSDHFFCCPYSYFPIQVRGGWGEGSKWKWANVSLWAFFFGWHPLHHVGLRVQWYLINLLFKTLWFTVLLADSSMSHTHSLISACFIKFKYTIWSDLNLVWHVGLGRTTSLIIQVLMQNMWVRTASASWWYDKYNYDPET